MDEFCDAEANLSLESSRWGCDLGGAVGTVGCLALIIVFVGHGYVWKLIDIVYVIAVSIMKDQGSFEFFFASQSLRSKGRRPAQLCLQHVEST